MLWWNLEWEISNDHTYIKYFVPAYYSVFSANNEYYKYHNENDFIYISVIYKSLFFALIKFKILLHRIRNKKRIRLFLLSTQENHSVFIKWLRGSSNLPIRKNIVDFI